MLLGGNPSQWFKTHLPRLAKHYPRIGPAYVALVTRVVEQLCKRGLEVYHVPFAVEDADFAAAVFRNMPVRLLPYSSDPLKTLMRVARCSSFIATRFHSNVFALLAGVPTISIAYAPKCVHLWEELGLPVRSQIRMVQVVADPLQAAEQILSTTPAVLPFDKARAISARATQHCVEVFDRVQEIMRESNIPRTGSRRGSKPSRDEGDGHSE